MISALDKYDFYNKIKKKLTEIGMIVNPYRDIQYGVQFIVFDGDDSALIRIYEGKKGLRIDFSQSDNEAIANKVAMIVEGKIPEKKQKKIVSDIFSDQDTIKLPHDPGALIGVDESGKGDYFGPLCTAGVYASKEDHQLLYDMGVRDSKKLSDFRIIELAEKIKDMLPHSVVIMGNTSYNDVYSKMQNLNHMLAWAHSKVIENVQKQTNAHYALSDQFGNPSLIKNALRSRGIKINLYTRTKAERYITVAAASILARASFIEGLQQIHNQYHFDFPKGCSPAVAKAAYNFVKTHGSDALPHVAKLHFVVTQKIEDQLKKGGLSK